MLKNQSYKLLNKLSQNKAFTIVELLIVIVVIGVLAAITVVSLTGITNQANIAAVHSDLNSNGRKLQLYFTQYGSYPTALDGSNCPSAPTVDSNYCLKLSPGNTVSAYTGAQSTYSLTIAKGASIVYKITPDAGPTIVIPFNLATGGNTTVDVANYNGTGQTWRVHTFTTNGNFTISSSLYAFRILIVGAGQNGGGSVGDGGPVNGGGTWASAGAGGRGGNYLLNNNATLPMGINSVSIGLSNLQNSSIGSISSSSGVSGGVGGAAGGYDQNGFPGSIGITTTITGTTLNLAGGGGGGGNDRTASSMGGGGVGGGAGIAGGGGGGGAYSDCCSYVNGGGQGGSGTNNTGGGGGGAGAVSGGHNVTTGTGWPGGNGASGIVIIAYQLSGA